MSRSARHTELESVTSSHRPLHDINRGIKTKIQIYTIGIILASRGSRMSAALPSQTPGTHRIICHINNWLENDDRTFKCHQYQMCKQLIKTTLSVLIDYTEAVMILTMFPWLDPDPSVSCLCQRFPTMLFRFFPTSSCILSSPVRA